MHTPPYLGIKFCNDVCQQIFQNTTLRLFPSTSLEGPISFGVHNQLAFSRFADCRFGCYNSIDSLCSCLNTTIGSYCTLEERCFLGLPHRSFSKLSTSAALSASSPFHPQQEQGDLAPLDTVLPVTLENDVTLESNVSIVKDVTIGTGALIKAGAIISKDVAPYSIVASDGTVLGLRFPETVCADLLASQWWHYDLPRLFAENQSLPLAQPQDFLAWLSQVPRDELPLLPTTRYDIEPIDAQNCTITVTEG